MTVVAAIVLVIAWIFDFISWQHAFMALPFIGVLGIFEAVVGGGDDEEK